MRMSERWWRALSLLERLGRGEVTVGGVEVSLKRSRLGFDSCRYAGKDMVVKHLLSGDYRVFYGEECIAWANGSRPKPSTTSNRNNDRTTTRK